MINTNVHWKYVVLHSCSPLIITPVLDPRKKKRYTPYIVKVPKSSPNCTWIAEKQGQQTGSAAAAKKYIYTYIYPQTHINRHRTHIDPISKLAKKERGKLAAPITETYGFSIEHLDETNNFNGAACNSKLAF